MTIKTLRVQNRFLEQGNTPLHIYHAEPMSQSPRPMDRFRPTVTRANLVGVMNNRMHDELEVHRSTQTALKQIEYLGFDREVKRSIYRAAQQPVWDFEHHDGGWVVHPRVPTYLNGIKQGKRPLFLEAGDVVSALPHGDGSFALHARVPIENEDPMASRDFAHVLMHKNAEPLAYKRVIAVLGGKIKEDGTLTELIEGRVRKAVDQFIRSYDRGVPAAMVFSGGPPRYEGNFPPGMTEAKAMQRRALQMIIEERPEFKGFEDPLKHLMFLEERSLDAVGNAFFLRRMLEAKSHNKFFSQVQKVDIVIEEQYENRFRDVFDHIFKGMQFDLQYQNPLARNQRKAEEEIRRVEVDRQRLLNESKAGNLKSIGRFLRSHHPLYRDRPLSYFDIKTNWYLDKFRPWAQTKGDPWLLEKGRQAREVLKTAGRTFIQKGVPAMQNMGRQAFKRIRRIRKPPR